MPDRRPLSALALSSLLLFACGRAGDPSSTAHLELSHRLIEETRDELFSLARIREPSEVFTWRFEAPRDLEPWTASDPSRVRVDEGRLRISPGPEAGPIRFVRTLDRAAEEVQALSVEVEGLRPGLLRLWWAGLGESFEASRSATLKAKNAKGTYTFDLSEHERWRGRIHSVRLVVSSSSRQEVDVVAVSGQRWEVDAEELSRVLQRSWNVELGSDVRNAVLTPPGIPHRWRLDEPATGQIRFAFGLQAAHQAVRFRLSRLREDGSDVLFEESIDPADESRIGRWHERTIDLGGLSGGVTEISLETLSEPGYDLHTGIPAWAHPEILTSSATPARPNLVLISLDTLRADRLSLYGHPEPTSPHLDAWAAERAVTFLSSVAAAPWTLPSHVSILSGLDALSHGVNYVGPAPPELEMLPEVLRNAGYATLGVTGGGWLHPSNGLSQGFDSFRYWPRGTDDEREVEAGVDRALEILDRYSDRSFFLFFHTYEPHGPHQLRMPYGERCPADPENVEDYLYAAVPRQRSQDDGFTRSYHFVKWRKGTPVRSAVPISPDELSLVNCLYDSGIAHTDEQVGRLLAKLRDLGLEDDTIVVVTSDHGESLGEDGLAKHGYLVETNLLVPLIIALPQGREGGRRISTQVSAVDIFPTVLDLLGLELDHRPDGSSLLPLISGDEETGRREAWTYAASSNLGMSLRLDNRLKYVFNNTAWSPLNGREELYELSGDTGERPDPAAGAARDLDGLRERLAGYLRSRSQGARIQFENSGCDRLEGEVRGKSVAATNVKAERIPPPSGIEWLAAQSAGFRVEPGVSFSVFLEGAAGKLELAGACGNGAGPSFDVRLDVGGLADTWQLVYDGEAWREAGTDTGLARIRVSRQGRRAQETPFEPEDVDEALLDQLRALGYVE